MAIDEGKRINDVLHYEEENANRQSRDEGVIVSGQNLALGAVLGLITASGKYTEYDPAAGDGSETAVAVLLAATDASGADKKAPIIRRMATLRASGLVWKTGLSAGQIATGKAELHENGLVVTNRTEA